MGDGLRTRRDFCQARKRESLQIVCATQRFKYKWVPFSMTLCILGILGSRAALAEVKATTTLTVLLFNRSQASDDTLIRAKLAIDSIFSESGVRLAWTDCPLQPDSVSQPLCRDKSAPGEIRVRILDRQFKSYLPDNAFGFAIPPVWATVYYEPALRLARTATDSESNVSVILSCLIAHEIGHLLLGRNAHAADGVMTARWDVVQIQQALRRDLRFTPEQSKAILRNAQARINIIGTASAEQPAQHGGEVIGK